MCVYSLNWSFVKVPKIICEPCKASRRIYDEIYEMHSDHQFQTPLPEGSK